MLISYNHFRCVCTQKRQVYINFEMQIMLNKIIAKKKIIYFKTPELADFILFNSYIRKEVSKFNSFLISG